MFVYFRKADAIEIFLLMFLFAKSGKEGKLKSFIKTRFSKMFAILLLYSLPNPAKESV